MTVPPTVEDATLLAESVTLPRSGRRMPNRLAKVALYESLALFGGGPPNSKHFRLYSTWAEGGWGMVMTGNFQVEKTQLTLGRDVTIPRELTPETLAPFVQLAESMKPAHVANPPLSIIQVSHSGRQAPRIIGGYGYFGRSKAPSAVPVRSKQETDSWFSKAFHKWLFPVPHEMSEQEIEEVIGLFVNSAKVAEEAGFDGVELHSAHGYFLASLLNPKTNLRTDRFGFPNELEVLHSVARQIRGSTKPSFVLGVKLNAADYVEGGQDESIALEHVKTIASWKLFDFIEISGGDYETLDFMKAATPRQAFFASFSRRVVEALPTAEEGLPLIMLTGSMRARDVMADTIRAKHAHLIGIGRPGVIYPHYPKWLLDVNPPTAELEVPVPEAGVPVWIRMLKTGILGAGMNTAWHSSLMYYIGRGWWKGLPVPAEAKQEESIVATIPKIGGMMSLIDLWRP